MTNSAKALYEHGIYDDASDVRVHVCVTVRRLYIFRTRDAIAAIETGNFVEKPASQDGIETVTALGHPVPWTAIHHCHEACVPPGVWEAAAFRRTMTPSEKGAAAVQVAQAYFEENGLRLIPTVEVVTDLERQLKGYDLVLYAERTVQVKCDYDGGSRQLNGTGNLYIQTAEINPLKRH